MAFAKALPGWLMQWMTWLGGLSAFMFVVHPVPRKIFLPLTTKGDAYGGLLVYVIATIGLAWAVRLLVAQIPRPRLNEK